MQSLDQEVASYHRVVDSVVEKAHNVFKMVDNLEMDALINNVNCRYQKLFSEIKVFLLQIVIYFFFLLLCFICIYVLIHIRRYESVPCSCITWLFFKFTK